MTKAEAGEALVTLYLRLNGYFTSGFIVHSDVPGDNRAELDVLAVRLAHNAEPARGVAPSMEIGAWSEGVEFIIGEVKSRGQQFQFNGALRTRQAVETVLQWWGHLTAEEVKELTDPVLAILEPAPGATAAPEVACPRAGRVRAILFSPDTLARRTNQAWFIPGPPMFSFAWQCFRPSRPRATCATVYDFGRWGRELEPIVRYFKDPGRSEPGGFDALLEHLGIAG